MSTASYGRSRSGDRFYNPPQVRRQLELQQQQLLLQKQKQQQEREEIRREKNRPQQQRRQKPERVKSSAGVESSDNRQESDDCASTATTTPAASVSSHSTSVSNLTNLDRFLEYTTPVVPAQYFSKVRFGELVVLIWVFLFIRVVG